MRSIYHKDAYKTKRQKPGKLPDCKWLVSLPKQAEAVVLAQNLPTADDLFFCHIA